MLTLKCTKAVQSLASLAASDLVAPSSGLLGAWYVNQFPLGRKKALIFMSETTLLSFVHIGIRKADCSKEKLPFIFLDGLFRLARLEGFAPDEIGRVMDDCLSWQFAKTDSKRSLGNMNDLVWHYQCSLGEDWSGESLDDIHARINRIPQNNLELTYAIDSAMSAVRCAAA